MCPFFISTHRWKTHSFYLALPLFSLNFPLSLHISRFSPSPLLSEDCLHARRVAEGAGEVIQLRISPSHLSSWYSYHTVAPWGFLPEHWLTEGDFPLSFQLSHSRRSLPCSHFSIFPHVLLPISCLFSFMLSFFLSLPVSPHVLPPPPPPKLFDSVCISNCVKAASCYGCWDGRGGNLWRAVDLAEVTGSYS